MVARAICSSNLLGALGERSAHEARMKLLVIFVPGAPDRKLQADVAAPVRSKPAPGSPNTDPAPPICYGVALA